MARKARAESEEVGRVLARPYARAIFPEEDGSFFGEIVEFPGCFSSGSTPSEALTNLEEVAAEWVRVELERGHVIPQPMGTSDYSGKLVLRISRALHRKAAWAAERDGVSLNQFIGTCLAECVGERRALPVTTLNMVAITQSQSSNGWPAFATLASNLVTAFTGELQRVENHA